MIRFSFFSLFFLFSLTSFSQQRQELQWKNIETIEFDFPKEDYTSDSIFFYHALLERSVNDSLLTQTPPFSFTDHAKPLDLYNYWEHKGEEQYDVLMTKVGYVLDKPIEFFSKERLSDPGYISQTMPAAKIKRIDSTYHISVGFGAPEIDYTLHFYSPEEFDSHFPDLKNYFNAYDGLDLSPKLIVVQHNFKYGKVMFQETSKMSVSISRYFQLNKSQTLVFNYTLNYIHNIPPSFVGGSNFLIGKIKQGIKALIDETQYVCRKTELSELSESTE
ncbi:hypothetical protein [Lutimonas zeaxanthinifaciens]|uniref:hypothetical protein n=1 Tax=Lutimonas zeaxanthinifaciens TaxID=3060215 RepID=UPI00265CFE9D|nr:hypothetical protein [Lutimonas sp. YSD2104]WKK65721.1 hypothetical protein QZH61_14165 [Lutimonas sp. YSD2104]